MGGTGAAAEGDGDGVIFAKSGEVAEPETVAAGFGDIDYGPGLAFGDGDGHGAGGRGGA